MAGRSLLCKELPAGFAVAGEGGFGEPFVRVAEARVPEIFVGNKSGEKFASGRREGLRGGAGRESADEERPPFVVGGVFGGAGKEREGGGENFLKRGGAREQGVEEGEARVRGKLRRAHGEPGFKFGGVAGESVEEELRGAGIGGLRGGEGGAEARGGRGVVEKRRGDGGIGGCECAEREDVRGALMGRGGGEGGGGDALRDGGEWSGRGNLRGERGDGFGGVRASLGMWSVEAAEYFFEKDGADAGAFEDGAGEEGVGGFPVFEEGFEGVVVIGCVFFFAAMSASSAGVGAAASVSSSSSVAPLSGNTAATSLRKASRCALSVSAAGEGRMAPMFSLRSCSAAWPAPAGMPGLGAGVCGVSASAVSMVARRGCARRFAMTSAAGAVAVHAVPWWMMAELRYWSASLRDLVSVERSARRCAGASPAKP